jgi:hypothetical protein
MTHNLRQRTHKLYHDRSVTSAGTVHNYRPDVVMLDKTTKDAYFKYVALRNSQNPHSTFTTQLRK